MTGILPQSSVEQSLVDHVIRGDILDLAPGQTVDEATMRAWDNTHNIRAVVLREILRGRLAADPDLHGLRLRAARIVGRLDLEYLTTSVSLELTDCLLEDGIVARYAHLRSLGLETCRIERLIPANVELSNEPSLAADGLQVDQNMSLAGVTATGAGDNGAVRLHGAHIGGQLNCDQATMTNNSGPALHAHGLQVDQDMFLTSGFTATGAGDSGAVRLPGARIGGQLNCDQATMTNNSGPALTADRLQVDQSMFLDDVTATGAGDSGAVRLPGARIGGQLACDQATMTNDSGPALAADGLHVDQDMLLTGVTATATGAGDSGAVRLPGARIGGQLNCDQATMTNNSGPALHADHLQVDQNMSLDDVTATGAGDNSAVRLLSAHIGGLSCTSARMTNESGPALTAHGLQVDQSMFLAGMTATGAVRLHGAHIGGQLNCDQATMTNNSGPALTADGLQVDQDMLLTSGFTATGVGDSGAVRLPGARIGGQLVCDQATMTNNSGPALTADGLQVDQDMLLTGVTATAAGQGCRAVVSLNRTRVGGRLAFDRKPQLRHKSDPTLRLAVDGLTYAGIPARISAGDWLNLLREGTRYAAQPYQQLAAAHRAAGHDSQARRVLMAQRKDQLKRKDQLTGKALASRPERAWGWLTELTLGYGYQPWRALLFLLYTSLIAVIAALWLGAHGALAHPSRSSTPGQPCDRIERIGVGIDLGLPLIKTFARNHCDLTASATGHALTGIGWTVQLLAWAFATLLVAGFTSAVRKT